MGAALALAPATRTCLPMPWGQQTAASAAPCNARRCTAQQRRALPDTHPTWLPPRLFHPLLHRRKSLYLPWKCEEERHAYEVCQYREYKRRVELAKQAQAES